MDISLWIFYYDLKNPLGFAGLKLEDRKILAKHSIYSWWDFCPHIRNFFLRTNRFFRWGGYLIVLIIRKRWYPIFWYGDSWNSKRICELSHTHRVMKSSTRNIVEYCELWDIILLRLYFYDPCEGEYHKFTSSFLGVKYNFRIPFKSFNELHQRASRATIGKELFKVGKATYRPGQPLQNFRMDITVW